MSSFPTTSGLDDAPVHYEDVWMTDGEYSQLLSFREDITTRIARLALLWIFVHLISILLSPVFAGRDRGLPWKDKLRWHNKVVSLVHAAVAFLQGLWWIVASGEYARTGGRMFAFFPTNANIAAMGAAYFVYDFVFCSFCACIAPDRQLPSILAHHAVFICAYLSTLVYPCVLSVTTYHYFQLTELSTVMLHVTWMMSKAQVQYKYLYFGTVALLLTFLQRVITTLLILWHVVAWIVQNELWTVKLPYELDQYNYAYCVYFGVCATGMLILNWTWFTALAARADDMVKRVQRGEPPTPDYQRVIKKVS